MRVWTMQSTCAAGLRPALSPHPFAFLPRVYRPTVPAVVRPSRDVQAPRGPRAWAPRRFPWPVQHTAVMLEAEVRAAVEERLVAEHRRDPGTRVVHELGMTQAGARIDLAVVNGRLTGWEIKTVADTLARLPHQQEAYSRVFDRVWLVADGRHLDRALTVVPPWWGVARADPSDRGCVLRVVRTSRLNRQVDPRSLVRLLWRDETLGELVALGADRGLAGAPRTILWDALADAVPAGRLTLPRLKSRVRARLRSREGWRAAAPRT